MMHKLASALLGFFISCIALTTSCAADQHNEVAFGVLAFGGEQETQARWKNFFDVLSVSVPDQIFTMVPLTLDDAEEALASRELDFLLTNPGHFQNLMVKHELAAIASLRTDIPGKPKTGDRYGAVILTRATENGPRRLADLKGKRFGAVAPTAFGGWQLALQAFLRNGINPERDFVELRFLGFPHSSIVHAILDGEIDAGTVRTGVLESMIEHGEIPEHALTVLNPITVPSFEFALSTTLVPEWMVAATPKADLDLRVFVARALLNTDPLKGDLQAWQPPQSLASVVEVQQTIFDAGRMPSGQSFKLNLFIAFGLVLMATAVVAQKFNWSKLEWRMSWFRRPDVNAGNVQNTADLLQPSITTREAEVLALVERGETTKEIARILKISPKTVEFHRHNLLKKFNASNMADLVHRSSLLHQSKEAKSDQT